MIIDPLEKTEEVVRGIHDEVRKRTIPALKRYPLVFLFLTVFGVAAVLHGFELLADTIPLFEDHPAILIGIGVLVLFFTGQLYKTLERMK
jgi:hypothetical protein